MLILGKEGKRAAVCLMKAQVHCGDQTTWLIGREASYIGILDTMRLIKMLGPSLASWQP